MKKHMRRSAVTVIALILAFTFVVAPADSYAATKNKRCTTYRNTLKSGSTVYCTHGVKIFKVNLKTKRVKVLITGKYGYTTNMKKKGNYLYYMDKSQTGRGCRINRINLKTGKKTLLAKNTGPEYVISGNKIYYNSAKLANGENAYKKREMKLNGKSKKASKYKAKMTAKLTNKKGYMVINTYDQKTYDYPDFVDYYLKIPKGKIFLESYYPVL